MTDPAAAIGPTLAHICEAAAAFILPLWRSGLAVERKSDESPVTEADRGAEALILQLLARHFPGVPVLAEEEASVGGAPTAAAPRFFLVDPLDGTKAFVRGDPHFSVNIGLIEDRRPVAGAVTSPASGVSWFTCVRGGQPMAARRVGGAEEQAIAVRPWPERPLALASHTLKPDAEARLRAEHGVAEVERMDSSLKLCRIAEGTADLYARHGPTMEWDTAAGHAVLDAAGGRLTEPDGSPFLYGKADRGFLNGAFVARGG